MQEITTTNWTKINGLDSTKTYILQARLINEERTIPVNWFQGDNAPQTTDRQVLATTSKFKATKNIYVKSQATPVIIVVQEIFE